MNDLSEDAVVIYEMLPDSGRIVNQTALNATGWEKDRLKKAKRELRDKGYIEIIASFGGPFGKITRTTPASTSNVNVLAANEEELYIPFKKYIEETFLPDDFLKGKDLFDVIVSGNKRPKDIGKWEIPDAISISLKKFKYLPDYIINTISYEIKPKNTAFELSGIFEAISHSKFGSQTYYCFEQLEDEDFYDNDKYIRIEQEAKVHGIGLMQIWFLDENKTELNGKIILEAKQMKYDPATLSTFIDKFFPEETKNSLIQKTSSW
ncbi:hypothetical protein K7J14_14895 [Treponema zuelzerae]|uniref:Uncharacterized protein n=1 Tax=Teretinema zuelzerae TaxID=156 RepID=A0AAE3EMF4_9SPIR|nr:hypothetical protein [Teretinema zuelzerae]MCD1655984.1 hypothetical protein [Teretinema zuelzerae]